MRCEKHIHYDDERGEAMTTAPSIISLMQRPEWLKCLPRILFDDGTVEIMLLREATPTSYFDVFWEKEFPVAQIEDGIREAFDAAMKGPQGTKP